MRTLRLTIAYDGTEYVGWQWQPEGASIQRTIEEKLALITHAPKVSVIASGRTDAGVHAIAQVAHVRTESDLPCERLRVSLNALLPGDIVVTDIVDSAPDFDARRCVRAKHYRYWIWNSRVPSPFFRGHSWQVFQPLDLGAMNAAALHLVGEHDFTSFRGARARTKTASRTVFSAAFTAHEAPRIAFDIVATGFLKQMVRNIVGTLVLIGRGRRAPESITEVIAARDRRAAGPTAPPHGLFLVSVDYA